MPLHKNPCLGGHEIYKFGRPILGHHYYILGLSDQCLVSREEEFLQNTSILHFLPPNYLLLGWGHEVKIFFSLYPTDATIQIWLR